MSFHSSIRCHFFVKAENYNAQLEMEIKTKLDKNFMLPTWFNCKRNKCNISSNITHYLWNDYWNIFIDDHTHSKTQLQHKSHTKILTLNWFFAMMKPLDPLYSLILLYYKSINAIFLWIFMTNR